MDASFDLKSAILKTAVVNEEVILSSGQKSNFYIDLRRVTLSYDLSSKIGKAMLELTEDLEYEAVGGLTLGADPVATAIMHVAARENLKRIDSFVVRKSEKRHGLQKRIEGPSVRGKKVLVVEDTSTTGKSLLQAIDALQSAGAIIVGCAVVVDRGANLQISAEGHEYRYLYSLSDLGLA